MEPDFFHTIRQFYIDQAFCDVKIVASPSFEAPIFCHALVLCGAVPELRPLMLSTDSSAEAVLVLVPGIEAAELKAMIDGLYWSLCAASGDGGEDCRQKWLEILTVPPEAPHLPCSEDVMVRPYHKKRACTY